MTIYKVGDTYVATYRNSIALSSSRITAMRELIRMVITELAPKAKDTRKGVR